MAKQRIRVKFLYHSGFMVENGRNLLVFDYYQGPAEQWLYQKNKNFYIFSSHSHPDHFNPQILEWQKSTANIQYILSSEITLPHANDHVHFLSPYETLKLDDLSIKTYNSTDLGVSFLVQCQSIRLFHAGDFNWWYWWNDIPEEISKAEKSFKEEVAKIKGESIDLAFFPVDPRLEHHYSLGAEYFIREVKPRFLIPMHFTENPEILPEFKEKMKETSTQILLLSSEGEELSLEL